MKTSLRFYDWNLRLVVLEPVFTSVYTCLFGKFCCILRKKYLPGDSPPAYFCLVCNKIVLENPRIFLVKTGSYSAGSLRTERTALMTA